MSGFITSWAIDRPTSPRPARSEAVREGFASFSSEGGTGMKNSRRALRAGFKEKA